MSGSRGNILGDAFESGGRLVKDGLSAIVGAIDSVVLGDSIPTRPVDESKPSAVPFAPSNSSNQNSEYAGDMLDSIGFSPEPNPIGNLQQPSFHFKLYLKNDLGNTDRHITIAETGATGINITGVNMDSYVSPNLRTKNTISTNISIDIFEPMGARLLDTMLIAANKLQVINYLKAPWMLELKFHGYDEDGKYTVLNDQVWRWQLLILDIKTQISEAGATHTISALPYNEIALANQYAVLPTAASVEGETVEEILNNIAKQMTDDARKRYGTDHLVYEFKTMEYIGDRVTVQAVKTPFEHAITGTDKKNHDERNAGKAQFSPGTDISTIVDAVLSACDSAVAQAKLSRTLDDPNSNGNETENIAHPASVMHRVDVEVTNTGYNPIVGDYTRKITFWVRPYDTIRLITSVDSAQAFLKETNLQRKKAKFAVDNFYLCKQYDYIFTGLNTEVERFDIQTNYAWAVAAPLASGRIHYGSSTLPRQVNDGYMKQRESWADLNNDGMVVRAAREAVDKADNEDLDRRMDEIEKRYEERLFKEADKIGESSKEFTKEVIARRSGLAAGDLGFGEELVESQNGQVVMNLPITILQDGDNPAAEVEIGVSSRANQNRSIYGSLLNQMYGAVDGNLQNLELTIRGDPYWLGPGMKSDDGIRFTVSKERNSTSTTPEFMNGDHMFIFRFKMPLGYDENSGYVSLADDSKPYGDSDIYSGFYATVKVTHRFQEGKFEQILEATRIPGWNISNILKTGDDSRETDRR